MNLAVVLPAANGGAIRMDCAAAGTAVAPEITVLLLPTPPVPGRDERAAASGIARPGFVANMGAEN